MKKRLCILVSALLIAGLAACSPGQDDSGEERDTGEVLLVETLPVSYSVPQEFEASGEGNDVTYTFAGDGVQISIRVLLEDDANLAKSLGEAMETQDLTQLRDTLLSGTAAGQELNLARIGGRQTVYLTGDAGDGEYMVRYLLLEGDYVVELRGWCGEENIGFLQRQLEEVIKSVQMK